MWVIDVQWAVIASVLCSNWHFKAEALQDQKFDPIPSLKREGSVRASVVSMHDTITRLCEYKGVK